MSKPCAVGLSNLETLLVDVLLDITDHLPLSSKVALTLCSHTLLNRLGNKWWRDMQKLKDNNDRHHLMQLLEPDVVDLMYCESCGKLHKPVAQTVTKGIRKWVGPKTTCRSELLHSFILPGSLGQLSFQEVHNIMKMNRNGVECDQYLAALSRHARPWGGIDEVSEARIIDGKLMINTVQCIPACRMRPPRGSLPGEWQQSGDGACCHTRWPSVRGDILTLSTFQAELARALECKAAHGFDDWCNVCNRLIQCSYCDTEYAITSRAPDGFFDSGRWIRVTTWKDVGQCHSRFDSVWERHAGRLRHQALFAPGTIHDAWERSKHQALVVEKLTGRTQGRFDYFSAFKTALSPSQIVPVSLRRLSLSSWSSSSSASLRDDHAFKID